MANEIIPSGIGDLIAGEVMATEFLMLLADREDGVLMHPALMHATGSSNSSNVVRVAHLGLGGYDLLSATTPGSEVANTALTDGSTDVTLAPRAKRYGLEDTARFISDGKLDPVMFAQDAVISINQTLISLIANVTDDFTTTAGTSGVDATWADVLDAKTALGIAKNSGRLLGIVHPRQWGDLETDALTLGVLPAQSMGGVITTGMGLFKGTYMGVDFFVSSAVPTANGGADRAGGIFARGGVAWADAQFAPEADANIVDLGRGRFERVRQGNFLQTNYMTSWLAGVAKAIDGAGVSLVTDA
jgi:hypothetical protein